MVFFVTYYYFRKKAVFLFNAQC